MVATPCTKRILAIQSNNDLKKSKTEKFLCTGKATGLKVLDRKTAEKTIRFKLSSKSPTIKQAIVKDCSKKIDKHPD